MKEKLFKFVYVKFKIHPRVDEWYEQWFLLLDSKESFNKFIDGRAKSLVGAYTILKERASKKDWDRYSDGSHISDADQSLIANILSLDQTRKTVIDDCHILDELLMGYRKVFNARGSIVVSPNNSFRHVDESFEIKDTVVKDEIVFPVTSEKDIKVSQWPNGHHWYVTVGNHVLSEKFTTYEAGLKAGKRYINKTV